MRLLQAIVETPLAAALGWTLLHSLWQGALLAVLLAIVFLTVRSPRIRFNAACLSMAALLAFSLVTFAVEMSGAPASRTFQPTAFPQWNDRLSPVSLPASDIPLDAIVPWLAPFWLAGVCIFYFRQAAGWIFASRLRKRGVCLAPRHWQQTLARLCARLRLSRPVLLLESSLAEVPVVLGHIRPCILIPIGTLAGLPAPQIEAILLHELAHIRRADYLLNILERFVEGLLFYHPAVWWIAHVIRAERENCCDDLAVAASGDAHQYAAALAALEQNRWSGHAPAVAATGGSLMKRIRRLLDPKRPQTAWPPAFAALALILIAAVTLAAWQASPAPRTPAARQAEGSSSPFAKWLDEEVVYIINNKERAAFLNLTSDDERKMFIRQFWERRNPTPGAPENAAMKEHYRRIAFANEHYSVPGTPGWRTDRGHMYIVYGPPDEIEVHSAGSPHPYATEMWLYHHVVGLDHQGFFTFIDRTGQGDYWLAPGTNQ